MAPMLSTGPLPRSTFKRPSLAVNPYARPSSPEAPQFEPLSPPCSTGPSHTHPIVPLPSPRAQPVSRKESQQPFRARSHHRSPSTIEALADAALSTSPQLRTATQVTQPLPSRQVGPEGARAAKRARSDAGPGPQAYAAFSARPSSSHYLPHPGGLPSSIHVDRQRRQSTNAVAPSATLFEDAELLLNFASRVTPRPGQAEASPRSAILQPAVVPAPIPPPPIFSSVPTTVHPASAPAVTRAPSEPSQNPSASLPSPQGTNEDEKSMETDKELSHRGSDHAPSLASVVAEDTIESVPQQTQTPPEEERPEPNEAYPAQLVLSGQDGQEEQGVLTNAQQSNDPAPATRPRRGWPKGKPRGPRSKNPTVAKPRSSNRRSRASTTKSGAESGDSSAEDKRVRRKSDTDISFLHPELGQLPPNDVRGASVPPGLRYEILPQLPKSLAARKPTKEAQETICASCSQSRESGHGETDQWISCNGCKLWFHFDCAGFKQERDVRDVDKFFCNKCEPQFGSTTYVRKSSRAHAAVDYAGLNQGILKTSDDNPEHHYIQPIKDGTFTFDPEVFPRMRPELVTRGYFETCSSFSEPVVIPAEFNARMPAPQQDSFSEDEGNLAPGFRDTQEENDLTKDFEYETVLNHGQDRLDMVVPHGLTVRHVSELVGPDEPLEVIDVKTQGTEGKWNLRKWADYYESDGHKAVRNVISLEVSSTKLGRLLRRPKVVRDIDLQDSVWPEEETLKGNYPKVQFYCLMSVADSFTDFHIDFGGSSVYYHILRGKKTFFFIPPKPAHLKKYEEWNNSHEQNFTWLPDATKECYRVDLSAGDTMLIPSGWIHAVWTPENSLVIGGNFLTRMHYSPQFRVVDIEKAIKTPQKFRYPHFQKVMWYTLIKYLETDPLPAEVADMFYSGERFTREYPIWQEFDEHGAQSTHAPGSAHYNSRYYSQAELDGLHDLINFIFRTVMISLGRIEGVTEDTRKKVLRSIPKSHGDPLELAQTFALWVAWKRGNEDPPAWAHPNADLPDKATKKLSARALKMMQRQEAFEARKAAPERQSARQQASRDTNSLPAGSPAPSLPSGQPAPSVQAQTTPTNASQHTSTPKTSVLGPKRVACDACRKRRIKCKHKDVVTTTTPAGAPASLMYSMSSFDGATDDSPASMERRDSRELFATPAVNNTVKMPEYAMQTNTVAPVAQMMSMDGSGPALVAGNALLADPNSKRGRSKACLDCRKSKRRCIHDENGKIDPVKAEQAPVPRGSVVSKKRRASGETESPTKKPRQTHTPQTAPTIPFSMGPSYQPNMVSRSPQQYKQYPYGEANISHWQHQPYMYPDPSHSDGQLVLNGGPYHQQNDMNAPYNAQSLEQLANEVLDSRYVNDGDYTVPQSSANNMLHPALQQNAVQYHDVMQSLETSPVQTKAQPATSNFELAHQINSVDESAVYPPPPQQPVQALRGVDTGAEYAFAAPIMENKANLSHHGMNTAATHEALNVQPTVEQETQTVNAVADIVPQSPRLAVQNGFHAAASPVRAVETSLNQSEEPQKVLGPGSPTVPKAGLNNIPLYQPPPPVATRPSSRVQRQSFSVGSDLPVASTRRSLSKTPAPVQTIETTEQKTPSSRKRKGDSISATPSTAKSRKVEHMPKEKSIVEEEEDESMRLARALQDEDWGLRRRSR